MVPIFLIVVCLIFYTPILNKILFPNGKRAFEIIHKLAKEEFGDNICKCKSYLDLQRDIISSLKKMKEKDFEENILSTLVGIEHLKQNDFGSYMALKFSYWAIILATVSTIYSGNIFEVIGLDKIKSLSIVLIVFTIFLLLMGHTIRSQHNQLEYLNFKLQCINMIKNEREKQRMDTNNNRIKHG